MTLTDLERHIKLQDLYCQAALERSIPHSSLRVRLARALHRLARSLEGSENHSRRAHHA